MPKISVIIPCYNIEQEIIDQCIKSILGQTFCDYEVIIIDDGSEIKYRNALLEIEKLDQRIKLIHQENSGVSAARNKGIKTAEGEYFVFVDGDDFLLPEFFAEAYDLCEKYDMDFLMGGNALMRDIRWRERDVNSPIVIEKIDSENRSSVINHLVGNVKKFGEDGGYFGRGPWTKLIKRDIVKKVFFDEELYMGEDIEWNIRILKSCQNAHLAYRIWYIYRVNSKSATNKYNPHMIQNVEEGLSKLEKQLDFNDEEQNLGYCNHLINELRKIYVTYIGHKECNLKFKEKRKIISGFYKNEPWTKIKKVKIKNISSNRYAMRMVFFDMHCFFFVLNFLFKIRNIRQHT